MLLIREDCGFCEQATALLERLSADYGFSLKTLEADSLEGQPLAEGTGMVFPPGIFIDGSPSATAAPPRGSP
ncbi:MAG: glutaredoxin family protein, partial [Actinomycetota bacterium]